jgi:hypothetical protein
MDNWAEVRRRVLVDGLGERAACRAYGIHWDTPRKILGHPEPPGYRRTAPRPRPKLGPFLGVIHQVLQDDREAPKKRRHTARRIFRRLRDEHGYQGGLSIVKEAVAAWRTRSAEVFVPLAHPPGEAQVDFGRGSTQGPPISAEPLLRPLISYEGRLHGCLPVTWSPSHDTSSRASGAPAPSRGARPGCRRRACWRRALRDSAALYNRA